jgi:hypothetical protein
MFAAQTEVPPECTVVANSYDNPINCYVLDDADAALADNLTMPCCITRTWMRTDDDKRALAYTVMGFAQSLEPCRQTLFETAIDCPAKRQAPSPSATDVHANFKHCFELIHRENSRQGHELTQLTHTIACVFR